MKISLGNDPDFTVDEAREILEQMQTTSCPGNHVELAGPLNYWDIDWDHVIEDDVEIPTDEEWLAEKRKLYEHVVETCDLDKVVDKVVGFAAGMCVVMRNGEKEYVDFASSPEGKRYYFVGSARN